LLALASPRITSSPEPPITFLMPTSVWLPISGPVAVPAVRSTVTPCVVQL